MMLTNRIIAKVIELREYSELSVFNISKRMAMPIAEVEYCLAKYTERPKQNMVMASKINMNNRKWYIFENRNRLTYVEIAGNLCLSEGWVRKIAEGFDRKKYIRTRENKPLYIRGKAVLNTETGIYYKSTGEAASTIPHRNFTYVQAMICGHKKNNTPFVLV